MSAVDLGVQVAQVMIDTLAWLLVPFIVMVTLDWALGFFRHD